MATLEPIYYVPLTKRELGLLKTGLSHIELPCHGAPALIDKLRELGIENLSNELTEEGIRIDS